MRQRRGIEDFASPVNYPVVAGASPVRYPSYPYGPLFLDQILAWIPSSLFLFMGGDANQAVPAAAETRGTERLAHEEQACRARDVQIGSLVYASETPSNCDHGLVTPAEHDITGTREDTGVCDDFGVARPNHEPVHVSALVPRSSILQPQSRILHSSNALHPGQYSLNLTPRLLGPDGPHFESPVKEFPDSPAGENGIDDAVLEDICDGVRRLARSFSTANYSPVRPPQGSELDETFLNEVDDDVTRKILIIGSNYTKDPRRAFTVMSLESPSSDKDILKGTFKARGYSVWSMVNNYFDRDDALNRVSEFLATARCGDVRAIVFTGHAERPSDDERTVLVPPNCPEKKLAIPADMWERTIRENTKAGVIVLSIFASCFSGDLMHQKINLRDFDSASHTRGVSNADSEPILVTFSSGTKEQRSYESSIELQEPFRVSDHFLHALNLTAQSTDIKDWRSFIDVLESHFEKAREVAALIVDDLNPERWIKDSPQTPMYSASSVPTMTSLFPDEELAS